MVLSDKTWRATKYPRLLMTLMSLWLINTKDKLVFDTSCTICATGLHRTHELTKGAFIIYLEGGLWWFPYFFLSFFWSPPWSSQGFFLTPLERCWFHEYTIWLPINIMGDILLSQSWVFYLFIVSRISRTGLSLSINFGVSSQFSEFFDKIHVRFSKESFNALTSFIRITFW